MPIMCPSSRCCEARLRPPGVQMLLRAQRLLGPRGPQTPRPCWGPARCRGRAGSSGPPPDPLAGPQCCPPQAPSVTLGFRAAADLLSPLALLRFSAVARGPDPPTGVSKEPALGGWGWGGPSGRLGGCMRVRATAPPHRPPGLGSLRGLGLVYFLYLFLFSGLEFTLSFLVHQRFRFSRWDAPHPGGSPSRHTHAPGPVQSPETDCAAPRGRGPRSPRLPGRVRAAPAGQGC